MFAFRLAVQLGYPHPDILLASISSRQFAEWIAYSKIEPFGEIRDEIRHGQQMAMTANINRDTKTRRDPFSAIDFMNFIDFKKDQREETAESISARLRNEIFLRAK